jgi:hypothetical protein
VAKLCGGPTQVADVPAIAAGKHGKSHMDVVPV